MPRDTKGHAHIENVKDLCPVCGEEARPLYAPYCSFDCADAHLTDLAEKMRFCSAVIAHAREVTDPIFEEREARRG